MTAIRVCAVNRSSRQTDTHRSSPSEKPPQFYLAAKSQKRTQPDLGGVGQVHVGAETKQGKKISSPDSPNAHHVPATPTHRSLQP